MIQNCWPILKVCMEKQMRDPLNDLVSRSYLNKLKRIEIKIYRIIDRMPKRITAVLKDKDHAK